MMRQQHPTTSESQRDATVAWLEQDDNFFRATALSAPSGPYSNLGAADLDKAELIETNALNELSASVNCASPQSHWDGKFAKKMLQHYLMEFKTTAKIASKPEFTLTKTNQVAGLKTIEDKLNSMCPHFVRLQMLHDPSIRATRRGRSAMHHGNEEGLRNGVRVATPTQQRGKAMPSQVTREKSTISKTQDSADPLLEHESKQDKTVSKNNGEKGEDTSAGNGEGFRIKRAAAMNVQKGETGSVATPAQLIPPKAGKKRAVSAKYTHQHGQKKAAEESEHAKRVAPMREVIDLVSDEEEKDELLCLQKIGAVGVRKRLVSLLERKLRRVEASTGKTSGAEGNQTPPRTMSRSGSDKPQTPPTESHTNTPHLAKKSPDRGKKSKTALKSAEPASTTIASEEAPVQQSVSANVSTQNEKSPASEQAPAPLLQPVPTVSTSLSEPPQAHKAVAQSTGASQGTEQASTSPTAVQVSTVPPRMVQISSTPQSTTEASELPVQPAKIAPDQPRFQTSDALRSAIAQVISQRRELLNAQLGHRQIRQPDVSDSDYAPSEEEKEEELSLAHNIPNNGQRRHLATPKEQCPPIANDSRKTVVISCSAPLSIQDSASSDLANDFRKELTDTLMGGQIPAILNSAQTIDATNLDRKRVFLRAKQLAFEQFKWIRESELQQKEQKLLRREMKMRESCARTEIKLKRMAIRAEVIQRMVLAGASFEDIVERLTLV